MKLQKLYQPHYATATDPRVLNTRRALRDAMLELLDHRPLESISIPEIAESAGVGYTTFYRHYQSVNDLLNEIATTEIRQLIETAVPAYERTDPHTATLIMCCHIAEHRQLWRTLLTGGAASKLREEFVRVTEEIATVVPTRLDWLPPELGMFHAASSTIEVIGWWLKQEQPMPVEQLATVLEKLIFRPISMELMPAES